MLVDAKWKSKDSWIQMKCLQLHTCDFVSTEFKHAPVLTFQNFIQRSAEPPPLAKTELCQGHHATAWNMIKRHC